MSRQNFSLAALVLASTCGAVFLYGGQTRFTLPIAALIYVISRSQNQTRFFGGILWFLIVSYVPFLTAIQVAAYSNGSQGIDFGIFSQVVWQRAVTGFFRTSLLGLDWQNFLTHHFSPYLELLSWIVRLEVDSGLVLIAAHTISLSFLVAGIYKVCLHATDNRTTSLLVSYTVLLLPTLRRSFGWEVHDEVLALPFLVWSLFFHLKGRDWFKIFTLLPMFLFKESLALNVSGMALFYAIERRQGRTPCVILIVISSMLFLLYTRVLPQWLWTSSFDFTARVSSVSELFQGQSIFAKMTWFFRLILPIVPFLFLHTKKTLWYSACMLLGVGYNIVAILITNFPNMYAPYNYYSVTPVLFVFLACLIPIAKKRTFFHALSASIIVVSLMGGRVQSKGIIRDALTRESVRTEIRRHVSYQAQVIADDYAASALWDQTRLLRAYHANHGQPRFDYVVLRKGSEQKLSLYLRSWSKVCLESDRLTIRCALERVRPIRGAEDGMDEFWKRL